jgi:MoxR-like ATPase
MSTHAIIEADAEPFYLPSGNEVDVFVAAHSKGLPVMLKGPTGVGKTRFVEAMTARSMSQCSGVSSGHHRARCDTSATTRVVPS